MVAIALAGCGESEVPIGPTAWSLTFPPGNGMKALPVTVTDQSGLIVATAVDPGFASWQEGVQLVAGNPTAVAIGWLGGMCDQGVSIVVAHAVRWQIDVTVRSVETCRLGGVTRSVVLSTRVPIDPTQIDLTRDGLRVRP